MSFCRIVIQDGASIYCKNRRWNEVLLTLWGTAFWEQLNCFFDISFCNCFPFVVSSSWLGLDWGPTGLCSFTSFQGKSSLTRLIACLSFPASTIEPHWGWTNWCSIHMESSILFFIFWKHQNLLFWDSENVTIRVNCKQVLLLPDHVITNQK